MRTEEGGKRDDDFHKDISATAIALAVSGAGRICRRLSERPKCSKEEGRKKEKGREGLNDAEESGGQVRL